MKQISAFSEKKWLFLHCFLFSLFVAAALLPFRSYLLTRVKVGSASPITVISPITVDVVDEEATEKLRQQVRESAPVVYRFDNSWFSLAYNKLSQAFFTLRGLVEKQFLDKEKVEEVLTKQLGVKLSPVSLELLMNSKFSFGLESLIGVVMKRLSDYYIVDKSFPGRPIVIYDPSIKRFITSINREKVFDLVTVKGLVRRIVLEVFPFSRNKVIPAVVELVNKMVRPTLYYDEKLTQVYVDNMVSSIEPVKIHISKGELIVAEGQRVTKDIYKKLRILSEFLNVQPVYRVFLALFLFALLSSLILSTLWERMYASKRIDPASAHRLFLFIVFESVLLIRVFMWIYSKAFSPYTSVSKLFLGFSSPLFLVGLLSVFIFGYPAAVVPIAYTGVLTAFLPSSFEYMPFVVVATSVAAGSGVLLGRGANAFLRGILFGAISLLAILVAAYVYEPVGSWSVFISFMLSAIAVFFCSFASLPIFEKIFGVVTDLSLLELANLEHPLLKALLEKAPGTYNHSMYVGILAESAARKVGANPILAKVGGYFHDIGKLKNPKYFIENTMGVSMHTKLSPNMSRLIIISHVKDGVELARQHKLPKCVIDIIEQHHGTSLISYFYHKAKQVEEDVDESQYRYPGPKPRSKEAAIVMLADCVEAAVRSLDEPTPSRIKNLVNSVINGIFTDGQLDECELTFRDVRRIQDVFVKMLISLYHRRIKYPGQEKEDTVGGNHNKQNRSQNKGNGG